MENIPRKEENVKVVTFNGSARKDGNTAMLVKHVLQALEKEGFETELFQLAGQRIQGCIACRKCFENKDQRCSVCDDAVNEYIGKISYCSLGCFLR